MDSNVDINELQIAANFIMLRKHFRREGIYRILLGLMLLMIGFTNGPQIVRIVTASVGALFLLEGALFITKLSPAVILMDNFLLAVFGVFTIINEMMPWLYLIIGLISLWWELNLFHEYRNFKKMVLYKATPEAIASLDSVIKDVRTRYTPTARDVIEMTYGKWIWRVFLGEHVAVFVEVNTSKVFVQNRDEDILKLESVEKDGKVSVLLNQITKYSALLMSKEHYERYLTWKGISAG